MKLPSLGGIMKICISETSYLFELAKEIEKTSFLGRTTKRTFFPTLIQESILGYDALFTKIGKPFFIQTKMPQHISSKLANEWTYFGQPYFRFEIYPESESKQHNLLVDLGRKFKNSVFYVGPLFYTNTAFNSAISKKQVLIESQFICTDKLQTNKGNDEHVICYSKGKIPIMLSEVKNIEFSFNGNDFEKILDSVPEISYKSFLEKLNYSVSDFFPKTLNESRTIFDILFSFGILPFFIETNDRQSSDKQQY